MDATQRDDYERRELPFPTAINVRGATTPGAAVHVSSGCTASNVDCTWTWTGGELVSDDTSSGTLPAFVLGGAAHDGSVFLSLQNSQNNPDCELLGLAAGDGIPSVSVGTVATASGVIASP